MAIDKRLKIYDDQGHVVDYDIMADDVKFLPDGKDLPTKLAELEDEIGEGGYTPPAGGIPKTDLAQSVQDTLDAVADKVDKETGKGLSTNDYTTAEKNKLAGLENYDDSALQTAINGKVDKESGKSLMTDAEHTKLAGIAAGAEVNVQADWGQTTTTADDYIKNKPTLATVATSGSYNDLSNKPTIPNNGIEDITASSGSVDIELSNGDTYTINLNHTHDGMAKLAKCTEATLPQTLADDTIYVQVDDATNPTEIEKLYLFGLEFVGGGGGVTPGVPGLTYPKISELTLEGDGSADATNTIKVKAQDIAGAINVAISGTGFSITAKDGVALSTPITSANGPLVISNADALLGVMLTIAYSGTDDAEGSLVISSAAATAEFTAKSVDLIADITIVLPAGWQADKAWKASGEVMSAPGDQEGYCTTEFFALSHDSGRRFGWTCKAGYTCDHDGITGDIPRGLMVLKASLSDANTNATYRQKTDPIAFSDTDGTTYIYNFISATFKMSELPNCYIYDTIAGRYLWAGANVDTSVAPNV